MPSFADSALRLLRQLLGSPPGSGGVDTGAATALDGNTAVAITETAIAEGAGLGASFPADTADLAWRAEQSRLGTNLLGDTLVSLDTGDPRSALATAIGLALSGTRATAFLSAPDLAAAEDLLASAAGRHLPLVVHVANRALPGQATAAGSGHEAVHLSADSGCFILFAANVQEAVDFTLIARRMAEESLTPGLVVMDGEQTALAMQEVRLPSPELVKEYLGQPSDEVPAPTPAQKLLFGERRRRVPRWHDPDRPVLLGSLNATSTWGLSKGADHAFFRGGADDTLIRSLDRFVELGGRRHHAVSAHRADDARILLVAQGAAVETAEAVADRLRSAHRLRIGVLGVRSLRPFPGRRIAELLRGRDRVLVLERTESPLAGDPPLMREVRAALERSLEATRPGGEELAGYPPMDAGDAPRCVSVLFGLGGLPLRGADLIELCRESDRITRARLYLGISFSRTMSPYPKRQVVLDRLRREYPGIDDLGVKSESDTPDLRPPEAFTLAVHRTSGQGGEGLAMEAAGFLQRVTGHQLRSVPAITTEPWGGYCVDRFTSAPRGLRDPGDRMPVDLAVLSANSTPVGGLDLAEHGSLLLEDQGPGTELPADLLDRLRSSGATVYRIAAAVPSPEDPQGAHPIQREYLLGALFGVMLETGRLDLKARRLLSARREVLKSLPEKEIDERLESFEAGIERVHAVDGAALKAAPPPEASDTDDVPLAVRELGNLDDGYDSLSRFWDQVGVLYRNGESDELTPDPYMAIGAIPPLSATFRDLSPQRTSIPALEPALCTGCGACWSRCPDGAIGARALAPASVLNAAVTRLGTNALRPVASKLAARIAARCGDTDASAGTFGELLSEASAWLKGRMSLPAEREQAVSTAVERIEEEIGTLPVAVAEPFFRPPGEGELLFLAVDPYACKACGICTSACEPGALKSVGQSRRVLTEARRAWKAWERLPETDPSLAERVQADPRIAPFAAPLLNQRHTNSLAGGDGAEPGSGERLVLRLAMAAAEARQSPLIDGYVQEIRDTRERISDLIRETLAGALPADDLDALARGLKGVDTRQAELADFVATAERSVDSGVDAVRLRRLVDLARRLDDLAWRVSEGRQRFGRARLSVLLSNASVAGWAGAFPDNPFATPVAIDLSSDGPQLAVGLMEGHIRQAIEGFALMRRARLELDRPADAARRRGVSDRLTWHELTPDEQALCPSLFVVGGGELSRADGLLGTDLPIKLILLDELGLGISDRATVGVRLSRSPDPLPDTALLALGRRNALIAQTSVGVPGHFEHALESALGFPGPALLQIHAPSPSRHGFSPELTPRRAFEAVESRLFPLFIYEPRGDGVFGSRLTLEGNPQPLATWAGDPGDAPTPASWALGERRFTAWFSPLADDDEEAVPLTEYLALDADARARKRPFVSRPGDDGVPERFVVDPALSRICAERSRAWRMLQELAGLVTPFTARVREEAREEVAADHEEALAAVRAEYEARIAALQEEMMEGVRQTMRERMMDLAGYTGETSRTGGAG